MSIGITAIGRHVPSRVVDNQTISDWTRTRPARIVRLTGITERRYPADGDRTAAFAASAVDALTTRHPDALARVGTLIVATSTPDQPIPATAALVHRALGLGPGVGTFDLDAVCTGFLAGVAVAAALAERCGDDVLVIGADCYPSVMDMTDMATVSLFGAGAGAVVVGAVGEGRGLRSFRMGTHSQYRHDLEIVGGGTARPLSAESLERGEDKFRMRGRQVREYAARELPPLISEVLAEAGTSIGDVDRWIFHQGSPRLVRDLAAQLDIDPTRVPITADRYGNTGAASIPITLAESDATQPLAPGETIMLAAVGGGMSVAAALVVWG